MNLLRTLKQPRLFFSILLGLTVAVIIGMYSVFVSPAQQAGIATTATKKSPPAQTPITYVVPARIKILKINVDAEIESVGLTTNASLAAPSGPASVGWFSLGPRPGEIGNAVIDGHSGWIGNQPAVFDNLSKLEKGDVLSILDEKGASIAFVVQNVRIYDQKADGAAIFSSSDGKSHLNLITCEGTWNEASQSYSGRLIVFADKS